MSAFRITTAVSGSDRYVHHQIYVVGMLTLACVATFVLKGRGTPAPFDPPREFVVVGPCKYVHNPMYWGAFFILVGFGLYHHSVSMLLFCLLPAVFIHLFVVFIEEKGLERRFGDPYRGYKRSVNRWLPKNRGRI